MTAENKNWAVLGKKNIQFLFCGRKSGFFIWSKRHRSIWYKSNGKIIKMKFDSIEKAKEVFLKTSELLTFKSKFEKEEDANN